ncbi:MAG TPA: hypothetical protein VNK04_18445, partial [Gemmataceae bacterium]|nr:hypothetical protein [Gemmataceae bacterium]
MRRTQSSPLLALVVVALLVGAGPCLANDAAPAPQAELADQLKELKDGVADARVKGDSAWMLISSALVMLMVPGLALFYGGMV